MAGQVYAAIEKIIAQKARGNEIIASSIRTKMILKGINVTKYTSMTPDDPKILEALRGIAKEFGVQI